MRNTVNLNTYLDNKSDYIQQVKLQSCRIEGPSDEMMKSATWNRYVDAIYRDGLTTGMKSSYKMRKDGMVSALVNEPDCPYNGKHCKVLDAIHPTYLAMAY